jgi:hypothetical protein
MLAIRRNQAIQHGGVVAVLPMVALEAVLAAAAAAVASAVAIVLPATALASAVAVVAAAGGPVEHHGADPLMVGDGQTASLSDQS